MASIHSSNSPDPYSHSHPHPHPPSISRPTSHQHSSRPVSRQLARNVHSSRSSTPRASILLPIHSSSPSRTSQPSSKPASRQSTRSHGFDSSEKDSRDSETYVDEFELPDDVEQSDTEAEETEEEGDSSEDDMKISTDHDYLDEFDEKKSTSTRLAHSQQHSSHQSRPHPPPRVLSDSASSVSARLYSSPSSSKKKGSSDILAESSHYNLGRIGGLPILQWPKAKLPIGIVLSQRSHDVELGHRLNRAQRLASLKHADAQRLALESEMDLKSDRYRAAQHALEEARRIERELETRRRAELLAQARAYELKLRLRKNEAYTLRERVSQTRRKVTDEMTNKRMEYRQQVRSHRGEQRQEQVRRTELERRLKEIKEKELNDRYAKERSEERKRQREMRKKLEKGSSSSMNDDPFSDLDSDSGAEVHRGYHGSPPRSPGRRLDANPLTATATSYSNDSNATGRRLFHPQTVLHVSRAIPIECHSPTLAQRRAKHATIVWDPSESQQSSDSASLIGGVIAPKRDWKAQEDRRKKAEAELADMKKQLELERKKMERFQQKREQQFQTKAREKKIEHERKISSISLTSSASHRIGRGSADEGTEVDIGIDGSIGV